MTVYMELSTLLRPGAKYELFDLLARYTTDIIALEEIIDIVATIMLEITRER